MSTPYCSHNGFFAEMYENIRHKQKYKGYKNEEIKLLYTGTINFMRFLQCNKNANQLKNLTDLFKDKAGAHYCLPDNILDFYSAKNPPRGFDTNLPHEKLTISFMTPSSKYLLLVHKDKGQVTVFPLMVKRLDKIEHSKHEVKISDLMKHHKNDLTNWRKEFLKLDNLDGPINELLASGVTWVPCTFCIKVCSNGHISMHDWLDDRFAYMPNDGEARDIAATAVIANMSMWSEMFSRPPEELQFDYDPDWVPSKISGKKRKQGAIQEMKPIKVRLYLPKIKRLSVDDDNDLTGERVEQLQHTRSGHWRHYKNGRRIWINSYVAGNVERGSTIHNPKTVEVFPRR